MWRQKQSFESKSVKNQTVRVPSVYGGGGGIQTYLSNEKNCKRSEDT